MSWWCSTTQQAWSWTFQAYPGIWLAVALLVGTYVVLARNHVRRHGMGPGDRRKFVWFGLGAAVLWLATDWPLGALGASYLAVAHMVQYMLYTLVAAPLIMLGIPEWMARPFLARLRLTRVTRFLSKPLIAAVAFNLVLIGTHAPITVDALRVNQFGSMGLDVLWLLSGLVLWLPLISPLPELRNPSPAVKCVYLFLASGAIPMLPGGMLTFADFPLYGIYELAPRVGGISASADQQSAGILMKIGNIPVVWITIFVIFVRWAMLDPDGPRGFGNRPNEQTSGGKASDEHASDRTVPDGSGPTTDTAAPADALIDAPAASFRSHATS